MISTFFQDVRFSVRQLRGSPGFTAVAVIALALAIASVTAIFSVVDAVLLHPLPYKEADRIVLLSQVDRRQGTWTDDSSPANYLDWKARNDVFSIMAAARGWQMNLAEGGQPERIRTTMATASFFSLFDVAPLLGRTLLPEDEQPGRERVAVLSYGLWKRRYGGDRAVIGRDIMLDGRPFTVVGVMPPSFAPDEQGELWLPSPWGIPTHPLSPRQDPRTMRDRIYMDVWARLKPGITLQQASSEMDAIARQLEKQYPNEDDNVGVGVQRMQDYLVGDVRPVLLMLMAAVGLVLLIGCANVANLLLARASKRAREISVRVAMGAGRLRLVRQLLTESVLLGLLGGIAGVLLAAWAVPALLSLSPQEISNFKHVGISRDVLFFSFAVSVLSGILFGLAPAVQGSSVNLHEALKEGDRGSSRGRGRTRSALVIAEVGISLVLLAGAGLLVKSFVRLMQVDPGFDAERLLVFNVGLPSSSEPTRQDAFYQQVVERLQAVPAVQAVGAVSRLPLSGGNSSRWFTIPGSNRRDCNADIRVSTPGYFHTMGMPLFEGRNFSDHDLPNTLHVAIVNRVLAEKYFAGQDPIGRYITDFGSDSERLQIVGVVGNVRHTDLETAPRPEIYLPFGQAHWPSAYIAVRSSLADPLELTTAAQNAVWSVDKSVPLANVRSMQQVVANSTLRRKFTMTLLAIFSGLALVLAAVGLYGVMAYSVAQRTREIGIRMALGAQRGDVLRLVVGQGMGLAGAGVLLGFVASLGLTRLMRGLLFGVSASDPLTFVAVAVCLSGVALAASYLPARRAARVSPTVALRYE